MYFLLFPNGSRNFFAACLSRDIAGSNRQASKDGRLAKKADWRCEAGCRTPEVDSRHLHRMEESIFLTLKIKFNNVSYIY